MRKTRQAYPQELDRLELTIRRLLEAHDALRRRADAADARVTELASTVRDLSGGAIDPVALAGEVERLERSNRELRERLQRAHEAVERIRARLQFAEEES
ncbi:MAG TPA: hypothetical protein VMN60_07850 [Longimicrobiales bacterium]|nr:hypothetical protein [Longimicrobiales bacterium]